MPENHANMTLIGYKVTSSRSELEYSESRKISKKLKNLTRYFSKS
jgi:hypothetical protein